MLFIDEVMTRIWEPTSFLYKEAYKEALKFSTQELFEKLKNIKMPYYEHEMSNLSNLVTSGCAHHMRKGDLSGCSMCNLHSVDHRVEAYLEVLKQKDIVLYAKIIRAGFENSRGIVRTRALQEFVYSYSFLSRDEVPDEALEELFGKDALFKKRPMKYEFETSAKSVTPERLDMLEKYIGRNGIWIRIGVECSSEWLRNHWINKGITDDHIKYAIALCHERGYRVTANLIMGIPGLTEEQSLNVFKDTINWLEDLKTDMYACSVLDRKDTTLQGFLYSKLKDNKRLAQIGIAQGEHTGLPWLFTMVKALYWGIQEIPGLKNKLTLGQFQPDYITGNHTMSYNHDKSCECNSKIFNILQHFAFDMNHKNLEETMEWVLQDPCYGEYLDLLERQSRVHKSEDTIAVVGEEVAKVLWPEGYEERISGLKRELSTFI